MPPMSALPPARLLPSAARSAVDPADTSPPGRVLELVLSWAAEIRLLSGRVTAKDILELLSNPRPAVLAQS